MLVTTITADAQKAFDAVVTHPLQTYEWGEFREQTGIKVVRRGVFENDKLIAGFQLTIHKIPKTPFTIGYLPKGEEPTKEILDELVKIGKQEKCIFIQLEPNVIKDVIPANAEGAFGTGIQRAWIPSHRDLRDQVGDDRLKKLKLTPAARPLFTKYTFVLDLTKSEEDLLAAMHQKARYNIKIARKNNVIVEEDNSDEAFQEYLRLTKETTQRQGFYAHTETYHKKQWESLPHTSNKNHLSSHLFVAKYNEKILTAWIVFVFKDALYYPYGASSSENREVMSSNLMMWEVIRYGKHLGLKTFDMWGALGPDPDKKDAWYGFHSFKERYGPEHVEFVGSYDLVINPFLYQGYKFADKLRWFLLKLKK